jgi:pilus assembly protein CpaE
MQIAGTLFWVTPEPAGRRELVEAVAAEFDLPVHFCVYGALFNLLRSELCELIGIEVGDSPEQTLTLVKELHERMPRVGILVAARDTSVVLMRAVFEAGASDLLSLPLEKQELNKALLKVTHQRTGFHASPQAVSGEVITLCGARGGLGVTTLAVNLAVRLHALTGAKVALLDLDLQRGDVATFLNLTPTESLATIAAAHGEVDELFLYSTLVRHSSGVFVLAAPTQVEEADLVGNDEVTTVLGLLRSRFRYTIVDTARTLTSAILAAFAQTDRILLLTDLSVPAVRSARRTLDVLARLKTPVQQTDLLVTQMTPGAVGMSDAVRALGKEPLLTIPRDETTAVNAVNTGAPLNGSRPSALSAAIDELATKLTGVQPAEPKRGRLLSIFTRGART